MVYSVDRYLTFDQAQYGKIPRIFRAKNRDRVPMVLVGNKTDLPNREVNFNEGNHLAARLGCPFIETSAKTGMNVEEVFAQIIREIRKENMMVVRPRKSKKGCILM